MPLWSVPGTLSRARAPRQSRKVLVNLTPWGQLYSQRPHMVQTQGHLDSTTSSSKPRARARMALRASQPGTDSVAGQAPIQVPQARQRSASSGVTAIL